MKIILRRIESETHYEQMEYLFRILHNTLKVNFAVPRKWSLGNCPTACVLHFETNLLQTRQHLLAKFKNHCTYCVRKPMNLTISLF